MLNKTKSKRLPVQLPGSFISVPRLKSRPFPVRSSKKGLKRESPLRSIRLVNRKTIEIIYRDNIEINLDGMKEAQGVIMRISGRKKLNKLVVLGKNSVFTPEAKQFIMMENISRKQFTRAEAIVAHSVSQLMQSSFYFLFLKNYFPGQFFLEIERAKAWLREPEEENNVMLKVVPVNSN